MHSDSLHQAVFVFSLKEQLSSDSMELSDHQGNHFGEKGLEVKNKITKRQATSDEAF